VTLTQVGLDISDWHGPQFRRSQQQLDCRIIVTPRFESGHDCRPCRRANFAKGPSRFARDFVIRGERRAQISDGSRVAQKPESVGCVGANR
jgi:hypothetical protein